jgi:osmoprotectant transport system ATP-binding protein
MILLERISKYYGKTEAVQNLTLEISKGDVCVIIGPSGCGKTTTLRMINRLIDPSSGRIFVDGNDILLTRPELLRRNIGYAIQSVGLFPHMTVKENIAVVPILLRWEKQLIEKRIEEMLNLVGLDVKEYENKYPNQLSGGEAQRIGVARALAANPPILLMDEPFGAVDPLTREKLQSQFAQIQKELKKTVILVTHDLDEAIRLADRIVIMDNGKLVQYDTPETILTKPANKFVHDFVGTDRALKRLSRISINSIVKEAPFIKISSPINQVQQLCNRCEWIWVVDDNKKLIGWVDRTSLLSASSTRDVIVRINREETAVSINSTLREALSRMLGQGLRSIPVINNDSVLMGEVGLSDIEAATTKTET